MKTHTILHLGAGVQSGAIYQLMADGELPMADYALFADTQDEPVWVYAQLEYLTKQPGPPIVTVTAGRIGDDLQHGRNTTGQLMTSIPAHTTYQEGVKGGLTRRQCTREYKIDPIERWVRRKLLGLKKGQRLPPDVRLVSLFGFSTDESKRAVRMQAQFAGRTTWCAAFPLMEPDILMTRFDAQQYIDGRSGFTWRSSRCVFCPLQSNRHWREIKEHDPSGFARAVSVDKALRAEGSAANRDMDEIMYVHRSTRPLDQASLDEDQQELEFGCDNGCFL